MKGILLENKYIQKITKKEQSKTKIVFNNQLLIEGVINLYIKDLLQQQKIKIIADYEDQQKIQKILLENTNYTHSIEHRNMIRNLEILLDNLAKINDALTELALTENAVINEHIKKALNIISINSVVLKRKK